MNKEAIELVKQYILSTAGAGISEDAYKVLGYMLQVDRSLASAICDVYEQIQPVGALYQINNKELDEDEGYEH